MGLILLEAFGAMVVLLLSVWWTMFSGRPRGEPPKQDQEKEASPATLQVPTDPPAD